MILRLISSKYDGISRAQNLASSTQANLKTHRQLRQEPRPISSQISRAHYSIRSGLSPCGNSNAEESGGNWDEQVDCPEVYCERGWGGWSNGCFGCHAQTRYAITICTQSHNAGYWVGSGQVSQNIHAQASKENIKPLTETLAIDLAANFIGETIIFSVAVTAILIESVRKKMDEDRKVEKVEFVLALEKRLEDLERKVTELGGGDGGKTQGDTPKSDGKVTLQPGETSSSS